MPLRLLVAARRPVRIEDFDFGSRADVEVVRLVRRLRSLVEVATAEHADVVLVDVTFPEGRAFAAMGEVRAQLADTRVLALVPDDPGHSDIERAVGAGATGFVGVDAEPDEFAEAALAVRAGGTWLPDDTTLGALRDASHDLEVTSGERRSRLAAILVGLIPLAGVLAAIWSLLWRRYLGHIGVRPVDIAVDPSTRTVDAFAGLFIQLGWFGPLLYLHSWTDLISAARQQRSGRRLERGSRRLVMLTMGVLVVCVGAPLAGYADLVLLAFVGPVVAVSILAEILGLSDSLPAPIRLTLRSPLRAAVAGATIVFVFLAALSTEALVLGPSFSEKGVEGVIAPRLLGFRAQPVLVTDVNGDLPTRDRLYLGGNADLYVLVDPCNDDAVEMVSVGSSRIDVIDEVTC